uniref:PB1-like domain-containing protein n=1 Tax=Lactuca sativa TaxID=4236 RepID=A0A9R1V0U3_LACSA|nr:hypothetical protein LSAT_V11C700371490 [Lactuca sativa]
MVLTLWSLCPRYTQPPELHKEYGSISSFFTFKINHGGSFTTTVSGRSYIDGLIDHFDFVDMDVFSVHELDDMMAVLGYNDGSIMYVPNHKEINLYIEHGNTRVVPYFKSSLKVRIEEVEGNHSTEMNGVRMKRKSVGSCSKKLDLNDPTDLSKFIVPYEPMINKKHSADRERIPLGGNGGCRHIIWWGKNLHDVEFFEDEYSGSKESVSEGAWSEGNRSEGEDLFVDLENIVNDVDVDMKDFHIQVDEDVDGVDFTEGEDLVVIDPKSFDSPIVCEDNNRERMLRDIGKANACSQGVVHPKAFTLGQKFKTKQDVKDYIEKHAVETKRDLHFEKMTKQG